MPEKLKELALKAGLEYAASIEPNTYEIESKWRRDEYVAQALWQKLAPIVEAAKCFNKMSGFEISYDPPAKKEHTFFDIQDRFNKALSEAGLLEEEK